MKLNVKGIVVSIGLMILNFIGIGLYAQVPILKVDLNQSDRSESETNEPGYIPWPITLANTSKTIEGVGFAFKNGTFETGWYKAGVQAPNYARLVNDGIETAFIEFHITGLQTGTHTLVTFHNTVSNPENTTYSPLDIYIGRDLIVDDLILTNRVLADDSAATAFIEFEAIENVAVVIRFQSEFPTIPFFINGFELNTGNPATKANFPYPEDRAEHVNIDNDTLLFSWTPPGNSVSQDVYFGDNKDELALADTNSPFFLGNQTDTTFLRTGFYNMDNYYWRVDPIDSAGVKAKGDVWYFKKRINAFPEAGGYGKYAMGGRGGKVVYVTNLEDDGPGSFRYAVENESGSRTILFAVSGLITLNSRLVIHDDYITVAGQTAPGKGVCFRWAPIGVTGDDLIVQNIRVRLGIGVTFDGMGLTGAQNSIIDHCSISWTIDEAFSSRGAKNITLQRTLISEALNKANHANYDDGEHGYAASIGGDIGSFHHNLLAHCNGRNWSLAGGLNGDGDYAGRLDIFNNLVYNWGSRATDGGAKEVNFVNNYYKPGESTSIFYALRAEHEHIGAGSQRYYFDGNVMPGYFDETNQEDGKTYTSSVTWETWVDSAFFESDATIHSAGDAYKIVLSDVGCTQPVFDEHDIRIINETLNGSYTYRGSRTGKAGLPDSEKDVGGWEEYPGFLRTANWDTDLDGLPNWWEKALGLDTLSAAGDFSESNTDTDLNGYTNLEEFLQWMDRPHYFMNNMDSLDIDLADYTRGFTNSPAYEVSNILNGAVKFDGAGSKLKFAPSDKGLAGFEFKVTDADGSTMSQKIGIYNGEMEADSSFAYTYLEDRPGTIEPEGISEHIQSENDILIYPNPVVENVKVTIELQEGAEVSIELFNTLGKKVQQFISKQAFTAGEHELEFDADFLNPAVYIFRLTIDNEPINRLIIKK